MKERGGQRQTANVDSAFCFHQPSCTHTHACTHRHTDPPSEVKFKQICHFRRQGHFCWIFGLREKEKKKSTHHSALIFLLCNINMIARSFFCASVVIWHQTRRCFDTVYRCEILLRGILAIIINKEDPGALMAKQRDDSPHGSLARIFFICIHDQDLQNVHKWGCGKDQCKQKYTLYEIWSALTLKTRWSYLIWLIPVELTRQVLQTQNWRKGAQSCHVSLAPRLLFTTDHTKLLKTSNLYDK